MNSKRKGNEGEREWAKILVKKFGVNYSRTPQSGGLDVKGDIVKKWGSKDSRIDDFHHEVKRDERLNIHKAYEQALRDCRGKTPIVAHRRNRGVWMVTLNAHDFLDLVLDLDQLSSV